MSGAKPPESTPPGSGTSASDMSRMPKKRNTTTIAIAVIAVVVVASLVGYGFYAGWFKTNTTPSSCSGNENINGAGSSFVFPLMNDWALTAQPQICVTANYASVGSGAGINQLTSKLVDFGASDAPLSPTQTHALPSPALTIPETIGAVTVMYNVPGAPKGLNLTGAIVADMYLGQITNWSDPQVLSINPGVTLANTPIILVTRQDSSGTTFVFTSYLSKESTTFASTVGAGTAVHWPVTGQQGKGSTGVAGLVASVPGAIGYAELNYAETSGVAFAKLLNPAGNYILPSAATTAPAADAIAGSLPAGNGNWSAVQMLNQPGANTYPIATFSYVMVYADVGVAYGSGITQGQAQALVKFLYWIVTTGQDTATALFYVPLPSSVVALDQTTIGQVLYNGATLSSH
jgi:phosphate transport system substrate-binding protein